MQDEREKTGIHIDFKRRDKERLSRLFAEVGATRVVWFEHERIEEATVSADIETLTQMRKLSEGGFAPKFGRIGSMEWGI